MIVQYSYVRVSQSGLFGSSFCQWHSSFASLATFFCQDWWPHERTLAFRHTSRRTRRTEEGNLYCITRSDDGNWGYTICLWNYYFVRTMLRSLLGVSALLRKVTINFVISVSQSVCMEQRGTHGAEFP